MLLKKLGFSPSSLVGSALINVIERIEITNISKYFGDNNCGELVDVIFDGISEALQEKAANYLFGIDTGSAGVVAGTAREAFAAYINGSEFAGMMKSGIKSFVCSGSFESIGNTIKSGLGGIKDTVMDSMT